MACASAQDDVKWSVMWRKQHWTCRRCWCSTMNMGRFGLHRGKHQTHLLHVFGLHANKLPGPTLWPRTIETNSYPQCKPRPLSTVLWVLESMELYRRYFLFRHHNKMKLSYRCEERVRVYSHLVDANLSLRDIFNLLVVRKLGPGYFRRLVYLTSGLGQQNSYHKADRHDHLLCRHDCPATYSPSRLIYWPST